MVNAAANSDEKAALQKFQDSTLKEKLVQGAREEWAKMELRRIEIGCRQKTFSEMREVMLDFFCDQEPSGKAARAFEAIAEVAPVPVMQASKKGGIVAEGGSFQTSTRSVELGRDHQQIDRQD